jgi:LPXTG-motif cell wall-anchored protein
MSHRSILTRTAAIALMAWALAAPTALARPAEIPVQPAPATGDYVVPGNDAQKGVRDAVAGLYGPQRAPGASGAAAGDSTTRPPLPGPPTWPVNPKPISPVRDVPGSDTGGGFDSTTIALGIAGLLAIAGAGALARRTRRLRRARVIA